ncbi:MAG TPA: phosphatase PAP2 family protein [Burkholderiales bacterium]|nr:phosphatase PAP2 family protein [Burkholderiales bacterium]
MLRATQALAGLDHKVEYDNSGIWNRDNQNLLRYGALLTTVGIALWEGGDTRLGRNAWQSVDSVTMATIIAEVGKRATGRLRPSETDDPNQWRMGGRSFPSGEVAEISSIVTPYVMEYGSEHPSVYALEILPVYDAVARVKVQAHWQSDVIAGFVIGTVSGFVAYRRESPLILSVMPHGISVGLRTRF